MEKIIEQYIDQCLQWMEPCKEYLGYLPFYEGDVEPEMVDDLDFALLRELPLRMKITQPERKDHVVNLISPKDKLWKSIDNQVSTDDIAQLERELSITLPESYKRYLHCKHYYKLFWDMDIVLYPKPVHSWYNIVVEMNNSLRTLALEKGYFVIGTYSDSAERAIKLHEDSRSEGVVVLLDYETGEPSRVLASHFLALLDAQLTLPSPQLKPLKEWEKRLFG